ncbi:MAG: hypothetical protein ABUS51_01685 [Acidobacteriota bacterium]
MKTIDLLATAIIFCSACNGDFSYTQTRRMTGGALSAMAGGNDPQTSKISLKGQKMKTDDGNVSVIVDFEAQTITTIDNTRKSYSVKAVGDVPASGGDVSARVDIRETGQKKVVNGFQASELIMTMQVDSPSTRQMGKMQMEMDMWLSPDVPGAEEMRAFYKRNSERFPWNAIAGKGNPAMTTAIAEIQKQLAGLNGVMVQQVLRVKAPAAVPGGAPPAGPSAAQMQQMQASLEKVRAQLEAMKAQGGPAAAMAAQQLARMGPAPGAAGAGPDSGVLLEMTMDDTDFSTASLSDAVFAVPDGYRKN